MTKIKSPVIFSLIFSFLLITTCTTNNTITGNSDQTLSKPTDVLEINNPATGDDDDDWYEEENDMWNGEVNLRDQILLFYALWGPEGLCLAGVNQLLGNNPTDSLHLFENYNIINSSYDFRDNYLSRSEKGEVYTACYYLLSKYSIENNLVNKYHNEHRDLLISSVKIAYQLQHGSSNDKILIQNDMAEKLDNMLKVYRNHQNHRDIDPVLDYLEKDLNKYKNKPKSEISASFN